MQHVFGQQVFTRAVMQQRLPEKIYRRLIRIIDERAPLDPGAADVLANAMKDWAVEQGATHFAHWFQPLTGRTAEKHTSFITPTGEGESMLIFSGKDLYHGEPDASSFPSGSLRESFEARGYTVWDYTSPVFVKHDGRSVTMFIPSAFYSYAGDALDYKTPLLRSNEALNRQAVRVLRALGDTSTQRVEATLGAEQEYFLVDRRFLQERLDLRETGRTLFGQPTPKGMAMSVHYFGSLHERAASFMSELNDELWKLGISAKTQHNEISPCQFELAPVFEGVNVATDHNQLIMHVLRKIAARHDLVCLLHAKPFASLGGSGKHINWSLQTNRGVNLLEPGETPHDNELFLVFLVAVIAAVDRHAGLIQASVADAGNDLRLGAMEAPPAILSVFLGEQLDKIFQQLARGRAKRARKSEDIELGVRSLPPLPRDLADRNRTSPFAFTGNRFEFRTPGSEASTAWPAFVLNTVVAESLRHIADELEKADDPASAAQKILGRLVRKHGRIIFNGDNYSEAWREEAGRRGLPCLDDFVQAVAEMSSRETTTLFTRSGVLSREELAARVDTAFAHYAQVLLIEARTAVRMVARQILPAVMEFSHHLAAAKQAVEQAGVGARAHGQILGEVCEQLDQLHRGMEKAAGAIAEVEQVDDPDQRATLARDRLLPALDRLRQTVDALELVVDARLWPLPTYDEILFKG